MGRYAIVVHHQRADAAVLARHAAGWLTERGHQVVLPAADADVTGLAAHAVGDDLPGDVDALVSLGGDGTMLRSVALANGAGVPILGVNVGLLGYLTEIEPPQLDEALARLVVGDYALDERMMLQADLHLTGPDRGPQPAPMLALNEVVLEKSEPGHTVRILVSIDGEEFVTMAADGLIVATPTGSTAYALSARGPIVSPRHKALVLTPVSPHTLFDRSLVLDPSEAVRFDLKGPRPATLSVDGRLCATLRQGDAVVVGPGPHPARLVTFGGRRFHRILKAKFGLTDR